MPLDEQLKEIDLSNEIDEIQFYQLVLEFRNHFLESKDYDKNRSKHRKPKEYLNEVLQSSYDYLGEIGRREEMRDVEIKAGKTSHGYVYTRVRLILEADKSLNLYHSIKEYCRITNRDFTTIALLIAEYRGLEKVRGRIRMDSRKLDKKIKVKPDRNFANFSSMNESNLSDPFNLLKLRSEIMSKLPSDNFLSMLAMQDRIAKTISPLDFIVQAAQRQPTLFTGADAMAKMMSVDNQASRTMKGTSMISRMFDFKPVSLPNIERYTGILDMLANYNAAEKLISDSNRDSLLLEVEYELTQMGEELNEKEPEHQLILLNEARNIRKIIFDIYKDHHRLLDVTSRQFEEMIAELLSNQGFKVELTKQTRDGGYDIIALYPMANQAPQKWLVECKRLKRQKVGVEIIRSFKEVVQANHVNRGIIATTSYFSADALKKQQETPYLLDFRDKDAVMSWIIDYGNEVR